jgi:hypothetical protein
LHVRTQFRPRLAPAARLIDTALMALLASGSVDSGVAESVNAASVTCPAEPGDTDEIDSLDLAFETLGSAASHS